jgi:hypothetical protein
MTEEVQVIYNRFIGRICKIEFVETLQTIWGYVRNLQFGKDLPHDIILPPKYNLEPNSNYNRSIGVPEWEFDIILLYSILYSPKETSPWYSLKDFSFLRLIVNDIRLIRDEIDKSIIPNKEDVFKEFFRLMHRQFIWQQPINKTYTYRFYKIFSHPYLHELIRKKTNLDLKDLYKSGLLFTGYFINHLVSPIPLKTQLPWFTEEIANSFLNFFSIRTEDFINKYKDKFELDDAFLYKFNPNRAYPLINHKGSIYCPIPTYIMWKITNGLYYDIVAERGFDEAFGKSFEDYCGLVFSKVITNKRIQVIPEIIYGKPQKKSTDWILKEGNTYLFVECKAKRLRLDSITQLKNNYDLSDDLDKMVGFIFQVYKSVIEALNKNIPGINLDDNSHVQIIIVTLDEWHLDLDPFVDNNIRNELKLKFYSASLDTRLLDKYPFFIRSIGYFENDCQLINEFGVCTYYNKFKINKLSEISDSFKFKDIFAKEIDSEFFI